MFFKVGNISILSRKQINSVIFQTVMIIRVSLFLAGFPFSFSCPSGSKKDPKDLDSMSTIPVPRIQSLEVKTRSGPISKKLEEGGYITLQICTPICCQVERLRAGHLNF